MHNLFVDRLRAQRSTPEDAAGDDLPEAPQRPTQSDRLEIADLDRALQRLPAEQREVLLLVAVEELTYREVASALGVPIGTVMSRLSRARGSLALRARRARAAGPHPAGQMSTMEPVETSSGPGSPITEADLHAFVDQQLTPVRHAEVEQYLAARPDEAQRVRDWRQQNELLRGLLAAVLDEPLPLRLPLRRHPTPLPGAPSPPDW